LIVDPGFSGGDAANAANQQIGGDGAADDAANAAPVKFDGLALVGRNGLHNHFTSGATRSNSGMTLAVRPADCPQAAQCQWDSVDG